MHDLKGFKITVYAHYRAHARSLPWRAIPSSVHTTIRSYRILVSEMMLQQTQVDRVIPKYQAFLSRFPTVDALQGAALGDVIASWQGLGYNRRAKYLHECAGAVAREHGGAIPAEESALLRLPGIGTYTARAVQVFAFNRPVAMIETNIRTAYLRHFFAGMNKISDAEIMPIIDLTVDEKNPREWYAALMDYGAYLKRISGNENTRSRHYKRQSAFRGSVREARGSILRLLVNGPLSGSAISMRLGDRAESIVDTLVAEGLVEKGRSRYRLPTKPAAS